MNREPTPPPFLHPIFAGPIFRSGSFGETVQNSGGLNFIAGLNDNGSLFDIRDYPLQTSASVPPTVVDGIKESLTDLMELAEAYANFDSTAYALIQAELICCRISCTLVAHGLLTFRRVSNSFMLANGSICGMSVSNQLANSAKNVRGGPLIIGNDSDSQKDSYSQVCEKRQSSKGPSRPHEGLSSG